MSNKHNEPVLEIKGLHTYFDTVAGTVKSVNDLSYHVYPGETLGVVGESGCGKSVTAMSIMRLISTPPGRFAAGEILYKGTNLLDLSEKEMRSIRGNNISMIFQEPMTSLNPVLTIGRQITEALRLHQGMTKKQAYKRAEEMLRLVQISEPARRLYEYPYQLSGGMRQRAMIALALACNPEILIADEPTTALDVTIQAQIMSLLKDLQSKFNMAIILITHDLGVVAESCDRVVVMYAGRKVEEAYVNDLFEEPKHPYTIALMASMPALNDDTERLEEIPGMVPPLHQIGVGCSFAPRCRFSQEKCYKETPPLISIAKHHHVSCFYVDEVRASNVDQLIDSTC